MDLAIETITSSFLAWLFIPMWEEAAWFAWLALDRSQIELMTVLAILASAAAMFANYGLGWLIAKDRANMPMEEENYLRARAIGNKYVLWIVLFPWLPFLPLAVVALGFLRVSVVRFTILLLVSRVIYYGYYLMQ